MTFRAWIYFKVEVVETMLGFVLKRRSFPLGEGEGGWGFS
jgi:hypothetical protein